jgi:hypothetical protein
MVFLRRDKRRAQLAPPGIDQRSGDVVLPSNLRDTRAGRKRLFQKRRCSSVLQRRRRSGPPKTVIRPTNTAPKFANNCDLKTDPSSHRQGAAQRMRTINPVGINILLFHRQLLAALPIISHLGPSLHCVRYRMRTLLSINWTFLLVGEARKAPPSC